jgi:hypothetical protein
MGEPFLIGLGVIEGLAAGIVGISGGPILAPQLVLGLGMPQHLAQGCWLAARLPPVLAGTLENAREGNILIILVPGLLLGAFAGAPGSAVDWRCGCRSTACEPCSACSSWAWVCTISSMETDPGPRLSLLTWRHKIR